MNPICLFEPHKWISPPVLPVSAHYSPHPDPPRDGSLVTTGSGRLTGSCELSVLFDPCRMSVGILPRLISCLFFALIHQSIVQSNQCDALDLLLCFFACFVVFSLWVRFNPTVLSPVCSRPINLVVLNIVLLPTRIYWTNNKTLSSLKKKN